MLSNQRNEFLYIHDVIVLSKNKKEREREVERVMDVLCDFANVIYNVSERKGNFSSLPNFLTLILES